MVQNILLNSFNTPYHTPPFHLIKEEDYLPAFKSAIKDAEKEIKDIVNNKHTPTFENSIEALEHVGKRLTVISCL